MNEKPIREIRATCASPSCTNQTFEVWYTSYNSGPTFGIEKFVEIRCTKCGTKYRVANLGKDKELS